MTRDEKLAYGRGYNAGVAGKWPLHKPPLPPGEMISALMGATRELRDAVDGELATLCDDDRWQSVLGDPMDRVDQAMTAIGKWIQEPEPVE